MPRAFPIGRIFGIRLDVHVSWFIVYAFVAWTIASDGPIAALGRPTSIVVAGVAALALFASVVVHELAHALVARAYGVPTRSIVLFLFGGVATLEREPSRPSVDALVAIAGPLMSVVVAAAAFGALHGVDRVVPPLASDAAAAVLAYVTWVNGALAIFNLIPAYPTDGGRVLRALLWAVRGDRDGATSSAALVGVAFAAAIALSGIVAGIATHTWQFGWYVVLAAYLAREGLAQRSAIRPPREAAPPLPAPTGAVA
jgi:Zn-dependent protease